jgi:ligand-binding sensor domain-containing protein
MLHRVISDLEALDEASNPAAGASCFVAVRKNATETLIAGNAEGLVHLALQLLRVAEQAVPGAHYHRDEASVADTAETRVVFAYERAPWSHGGHDA